MAVNFPSNPTNGDTVTVGGINYVYDSTQGVWSDSPQGLAQSIDNLTDVDTSTTAPANRQVLQWNSTNEEWGPADSGVQVYATIDDLPLSGVTEGSMALVDSTDKLYIFSDSGWYSIAIVNQTPSITGVNATYTLATDGTATTVTVTATDPEGLPITYSIVSDTSGNIATVAQGTGANTNQWTITPSTSSANAGNFTLVFRASDGVNIASASSTFELKFQILNSNYTTALITPTDNGYTSNKVFRDSSGNNHTITANGDATQNTFSPYRYGGYSTYFDGSGDYLNCGNDASLSFGTGEFTIECWIYRTATSGTYQAIISANDASGAGAHMGFFAHSSNNTISLYSSNSNLYTTSNTISSNTWHHICATRNSSNVLKIYIDGTEGYSGTVTDSFNTGANGFNVGQDVSSSNGVFAGYIADVRLVKGTAITPSSGGPTERLTAVTNTSLLTCHLPYIADGSTNAHSITVNGNTKTEPFGPYDYQEYEASTHSGSAYFDGSGDYLGVPDNSDFDFDGDFCVELWLYREGDTSGTYQSIIGGNGNGVNGWTIYITNSTNALQFFFSSFLLSGGTVIDKQWNHVAVTRSGTSLQMFLNGKVVDSATNSTTFTDSSGGGGTRIGYDFAGNGYYQGNIADVRVVKGSAVYTSAFTPPTAPLTAITNTSLLLPFDDATIVDKSQVNKALKLVGNTTISETQTKYLNYSMYFDGSGDYIEVTDALGEFTNYSNATLEMWVYPTTSSGSQNLIEKFTPASGPGWTLYTPTGTLNLQWYGGGTTNSSTAMTINQWNHVAVVHYNGTRKIYVNGTGGTGVTVTSSVSSNPLRIGVRGTTGNYFNGYMSDIRIQLGRAVYTADFTPPTAALEG